MFTRAPYGVAAWSSVIVLFLQLCCPSCTAYDFTVEVVLSVPAFPAYERDTMTFVQRGGYDGAGGDSNLWMYSGSLYDGSAQFLGTSGDAYRSSNGGMSWQSVNDTVTNTTVSGVTLQGLPTSFIDIPAGVWTLRTNSILLLGGHIYSTGVANSVFYSTDDGTTFQLGTAAAPWSGRERPVAAIVRGLAVANGTYADESYIVAGGLQLSDPTNNVWLSQSVSGATWQVQSSAAPFPTNLIGHAIAAIRSVLSDGRCGSG